jgi:hypothetical protein
VRFDEHRFEQLTDADPASAPLCRVSVYDKPLLPAPASVGDVPPLPPTPVPVNQAPPLQPEDHDAGEPLDVLDSNVDADEDGSVNASTGSDACVPELLCKRT